MVPVKLVLPSLVGCLALWGLAACSSVKLPKPPLLDKEDTPKTVDFTRDVRPFLESRCLSCHHAGKAVRGLNLETRKLADSSWRGGPVIVPGSPDRSALVQVLYLDIDRPSGPAEHRVTFAERERLATWIREGASWPSDIPPLRPR
jgi:hypothetical protein